MERDVPANGLTVALFDEIEGDVSGWTITSDPGLTNGEWEQADPNATICCGGQLAAPEDDASPDPGKVKAFVTQNGPPGGAAFEDDVDGGFTYLTSPVIDLDGTDAEITYARWFFTADTANDRLFTRISNNGGSTWVDVEASNGTGGQWEYSSFVVGDHVTPTADVRDRD